HLAAASHVSGDVDVSIDEADHFAVARAALKRRAGGVETSLRERLAARGGLERGLFKKPVRERGADGEAVVAGRDSPLGARAGSLDRALGAEHAARPVIEHECA